MKKELIVLLVLLGVFLAIGCTENGSEAVNETGTPTAETPVSEQASETILVSAAASLTEAFTDMESRFEAENPGADVNFNFAGSGSLRTQIEGVITSYSIHYTKLYDAGPPRAGLVCSASYRIALPGQAVLLLSFPQSCPQFPEFPGARAHFQELSSRESGYTAGKQTRLFFP